MKTKWRRFAIYLLKYRRMQTAAVALSLIAVLLSLANPFLIKVIIDKAFGNKDLGLFLLLSAAGLIIFAANTSIQEFKDYLSIRINRLMIFDVTKDVFTALENRPLDFFKDSSVGANIYKINQDVKFTADFISEAIPRAVVLFSRLVLISAVVFILEWRLAFFALVLLPTYYLSSHIFGRLIKEKHLFLVRNSETLYKHMHEVFGHMHLVKALGREPYEKKRIAEVFTGTFNADLSKMRLLGLINFSQSLLGKILVGGMALFGGYMVIEGRTTLGNLSAVMIYIGQLAGITRSIGLLWQKSIVSTVSAERLEEILDSEKDYFEGKKIINQTRHRQITVDEMSFSYKPDVRIFDGMSFYIEPAARIALTGYSGSGKTTFLMLMLGLYKPTGGRILLNGDDIETLDGRSYRERTGVALQESLLWDDTVRNNIRYGNVQAGDDEIAQAAKLAEIDDFIKGLPEGYESRIGEMACRVSEGQKQRIALARALVRNPGILILDEALSSVDSGTEEKIIDNIKGHFKDTTIIIVSHRLSAIKKMDRVYFIENKSTIREGSHGELFEKNGKYRDMVRAQIEGSSADLASNVA